jgi:putative chitinase
MSINLELGDTRLIRQECARVGLSRAATAYVLATAWHETAHTMRPVEEAFWLSDAWRRRNLRYYPWHGRGYVQLTWRENYERAAKHLGIDLTTDPRAAMEPATAAKILVAGMKEGWFTGKKLSDYITAYAADYAAARRIVNGTDKAHAIAGIAEDYEAALTADGKVAPVPSQNPSLGFWASIIAAFRSLFKGA